MPSPRRPLAGTPAQHPAPRHRPDGAPEDARGPRRRRAAGPRRGRAAGRARRAVRRATARGAPAGRSATGHGRTAGRCAGPAAGTGRRDTSRVTPELKEAFEETDLAHTLAVSGANFTIVLALLLGPPGLAQRSERRGLAPRLGISLRATAVLGGVLASAFVVVCRPDPSVLRPPRAEPSPCSPWPRGAAGPSSRRWRRPSSCWCCTTHGWPAATASCSPCWPPAPCSRSPRAGAPRCAGAASRPGSPRRWPPPLPRRPCARRLSPCCRRG
ncbi:ComEC/Rec2 family competence protein [Streptomyces parvulus]|nr:ComEC/Rec2 family competence protein [Streptomyces parvulus]